MEPRTRRRLTIWWIAVLVTMSLPFVLAPFTELGAIGSIAWYVAIPLSIVTFRRAGKDQHLQRPGWYRTAMIAQLVVAVLGFTSASHTVFANDRPGFIAIATIQLVVAISSWRALTRPDARRAILSSLIAQFATVIALVIDIALDLHTTPVRVHRVVFFDLWTTLALSSVFLAWVAGSFVCLAAVRTFGQRTNLPDARAV
jgi:hypothetical protein